MVVIHRVLLSRILGLGGSFIKRCLGAYSSRKKFAISPPFFTTFFSSWLQNYLSPRSTAPLPLSLDPSHKDGDRRWTTRLVDPILRSKLYSAMYVYMYSSSLLPSTISPSPPSPPSPLLPLLPHFPPILLPSISDYTRTSTWTDPRSLTPIALTEFEWNILPPGWERFLDNHGNIYYVKWVFILGSF